MREKDLRLSLSLQKLTSRLLVFSIGLTATSVFAEIVSVEGSGEYGFGPNISEQRACDLAQEQMVSDAARSHFGERIEVDEAQICSSAKAKASVVACDLDQRMFFSLDENISLIDIEISETKVDYPQETKNYSCKATGIVRFQYSVSSIDRNWITSLAADSTLLREDKRLVFTATSSEAGFHYIFEDQGRLGFNLLYPNELDVSRKVSSDFSVPSSSAKRSYSLILDRDAAAPSGRFLRFLMLSSKSELELRRLNSGLVSREQLAMLKETLKSGGWTEKALVLEIVQ